MLRKCPVISIALERTWLLPCFISDRVNKVWCIIAISTAAQTTISWLDNQKCLRGLWMTNYFQQCNPFFHRRKVARLSLLYQYFHSKYPNELHDLVAPAQSLKVMSLNARYTVGFSLSVPLLKRKFHLNSFFCRTVEQIHKRILSW